MQGLGFRAERFRVQGCDASIRASVRVGACGFGCLGFIVYDYDYYYYYYYYFRGGGGGS